MEDDLPESLPVPPGELETMTPDERIEEFLRQLAMGHELNTAAHNVGIHRSTIWRRRKADPAFDKQVTEAMKVVVPQLEARAHQLAMRGNAKLLMFLLAARDPATYGNKTETTHKGGVAINVVTGLPKTPVDDLV